MPDVFSSLGYGADNEMSPDIWKQYMMDDLARRDKNFQNEFDYYIKSRNLEKRQRKMGQWADILGSVGNMAGQFYAKGQQGAGEERADYASRWEEQYFGGQQNWKPPFSWEGGDA